ncbi:hypothetical protein H5410_002478 [Solanum commersonii]|uniref:Uncharacterized protein n=1 Tax=Solanum commersonii TaxID=4109 RepID=A0A9J6B215_SOLCO|nr:hypothetical protein H5410_002478 [Solanum commersonii]
MHSWKIQERNSLFEAEDVNAILSIPISIAGSNDRLIWHHTKTGNYEVKSGYYIAKDLIDAGLQNDDGRASIGIVALDSLMARHLDLSALLGTEVFSNVKRLLLSNR